jgi:hypothetical protein
MLFRGEAPNLGKITVSSSDPLNPALEITAADRMSAAQSILVDTINCNRAAGHDGLKLIVTAKDNALTGNDVGVNARVNNSVASSTGKIIGGKFYAANNNASSSLTIHAAEIWALTKGVAAATVRGAEIGLDFDGGEVVTEATGLRVVSQAGGTITTHVGVNVVDDSASTPGGRVFDAFVLCSKTASQLPGPLLKADFSNYAAVVAGITLTAGDIPILAYKDKDGTQHVLVATDGDAVAIRT